MFPSVGLRAAASSTTCKLLDLITARSVVVVSTTCGVLYAAASLLRVAGTHAKPASQLVSSSSRGTEAQPTPAATLEIQAQSRAHLWVLDSHGGVVGTNPQTGLVRLDVPGATYSGQGASPEVVTIPDAQGTYRVRLAGQTTGAYDLQVIAFPQHDRAGAIAYQGNGEVLAGNVLETVATIAPREGETPALDVSPVRPLPGQLGM